MEKINVLFVCLGNICRSPLAEAIFTKMVEEKGLSDQINIDSAGTANYHIGERPDPRTIDNARANGVELLSRARQFVSADFELYDYIIPMDDSNLQNIIKLKPDSGIHNYKVIKMRKFDPEQKGADVPDPYYGGAQGFQNVFDILKRSNEHFIEHLLNEHNF